MNRVFKITRIDGKTFYVIADSYGEAEHKFYLKQSISGDNKQELMSHIRKIKALRSKLLEVKP